MASVVRKPPAGKVLLIMALVIGALYLWSSRHPARGPVNPSDRRAQRPKTRPWHG